MFKIEIHPAAHVLEIVYPHEVKADDVAAYTKRCRDLILLLGSHWTCLVDQTATPVIPQSLTEEIAQLNAFALAHGMQRCARVVAGAFGELQAWRITRDVKGAVPIRTFTSRDEAWAWIRQGA